MKLLLCCTKEGSYLYLTQEAFKERPMLPRCVTYKKGEIGDDYLNGKVVAECDYEIEEIKLVETPEYAGDECHTFVYDVSMNFETKTLNEDKLCEQSCLRASELNKYLDLFKEREIYGCAIHIKNLHIFDKPIEIGKFYAYSNKLDGVIPVARLSSNRFICTDWQDIGGVPVCRGTFGHSLVLKPEELCRVLNEKQTTVVRKKVSKGMLLP